MLAAVDPVEVHPAERSLDADLARQIAGAPPGMAREAEAELYRRLAPRVRLYGLRHLRNAQAAADLTQQVLLMTIERLREGEVREVDRLASYVLGMCRMVILDLRRGEARRQRALDQFADDLPRASVSDEPRLDTERLVLCLDRLAEREKSVLVLSFYSERTAGEVGQELGLSPGNVRIIRHRELERLRDCMAGKGTPA